MLRGIAGPVAAAIVLVAFACGSKSSTGVSVPITGEWTGTTSGANGSIGFDMTLSEDSTEHFAGSGLLTGLAGSGGSVAYTVSGTRSGSSVTMALNASGFLSPLYTGTLTGDNTLRGQLNGSGFTDVSLTLQRR